MRLLASALYAWSRSGRLVSRASSACLARTLPTASLSNGKISRGTRTKESSFLAGGRLFPGDHHPAIFSVVDDLGHSELSIWSTDGIVRVKVIGDEAESLPVSSCWGSVQEASSFFEGGSLGYSVTEDDDRLDGLLLQTVGWHVRPPRVREVYSSFFCDPQLFPEGSIEFDHAFVMRDLAHEWHRAEDLYVLPKAA